MCTGLEIGLILAAAGAAAGGYGAYRQGDEAQANNIRMATARNQELSNTLARNRVNAEEARKVYTGREEEIQPERLAARQEDLTADRTATLEGAVEGANVEDVPLAGSAPTVVKSEIAKKLLGAMTEAKESAKRLGKVGGYGDLWFDQGLANTAAGRDIDMWSDFNKGNLGILPYSQDFASYQAYKPSSGIGEIFQGVGSVLGAAGGSMAGGRGLKYLMPTKTNVFPVMQ
jgi:hypothetical protein